jgi:hypothetical protein
LQAHCCHINKGFLNVTPELSMCLAHGLQVLILLHSCLEFTDFSS